MIRILFTNKKSDHKRFSEAKIQIDDFEENIRIPVDYWNKLDYMKSWHEAIQIILKGSNDAVSVLITQMYDPSNPRFAIMLWPLYREKDKVFIHNEYLSLKDAGINKELSIRELVKYVLPRDEKFDLPPSEWCIDLRDLEEFDDYIQNQQLDAR